MLNGFVFENEKARRKMQYPNIHPAIFQSRQNRFVARVKLNGREEIVHVKNTGRCRELLLPGTQVWLVESDNPARKTRYDLVAVQKGSLLINMDAQAPNHIFQEWAEKGEFLPDITEIHPEFTYADSRFDFLLHQEEKQHLVEVKGVTLEENGVASFPDAPTERGVKHIKGLISALEEGYECWLCFVVQMQPIKYVRPNDRTHPAFGAALRRAAEAGVRILAVECQVEPDCILAVAQVPVRL